MRRMRIAMAVGPQSDRRRHDAEIDDQTRDSSTLLRGRESPCERQEKRNGDTQ